MGIHRGWVGGVGSVRRQQFATRKQACSSMQSKRVVAAGLVSGCLAVCNVQTVQIVQIVLDTTVQY